MKYEGKAHIVGDNINTDYVIASHRKRDTIDPDVLKEYFLEDIEPGFYKRIEQGDILVAGKNFGCGSAMEVAATVIKATGIRAVLAKSFSRSFYRNGINNGLLLIELDTNGIENLDVIRVELESEKTMVINESKNIQTTCTPLPSMMQKILQSGGIVPYFVQNGGNLKL
jgi:3-isopropylmalate/(R)-2-methylmalate dehydratase small subunit